MAVFGQSSRYCYNNDQTEFSGILDIFVHHARNIHNICIYHNQDVYAKFSLTYSPDDTVSTRVINGGGKNPDFNEKLAMKVAQPDSVLKCEIWMLSRIRNLLEDQLLGFALVPISMVAGEDKLTVTEEFSLSSTDLFHSPAGTVKLSLSLNTGLPPNPSSKPYSHVSGNSSITSEVVFLDRNNVEPTVDPAEYSRIEFPDMNTVHQNQKMVSEYFTLAGHRPSLVLHLGLDDSEMTLNSSEENLDESSSSGLLSSTTTNVSDDNRNTADSVAAEPPKAANEQGKPSLEAEQSVMQQQIVDMYMKSMHQFTESLAKMKLPMDLDKPETRGPKDGMHTPTSNKRLEADKKDGSRVFYGSRAFF